MQILTCVGNVSFVSGELLNYTETAYISIVRLMFWTDHGTTPSVKRANMDGSSVAEIITDTNTIKWPNGIAIDYTGRETPVTI